MERARSSLPVPDSPVISTGMSRAATLRAVSRTDSSRGESPIDPKVARQLLTARASAPVAPDLTPREAEVLGLVRQGMANKQIANRLSISVKTVEKHRSNLMRKQSLRNAAAATMYAVRIGLVDAEPTQSE